MIPVFVRTEVLAKSVVKAVGLSVVPAMTPAMPAPPVVTSEGPAVAARGVVPTRLVVNEDGLLVFPSVTPIPAPPVVSIKGLSVVTPGVVVNIKGLSVVATGVVPTVDTVKLLVDVSDVAEVVSVVRDVELLVVDTVTLEDVLSVEVPVVLLDELDVEL